MAKYLFICLLSITIIGFSSCSKKSGETSKVDSTKTAVGDKPSTSGDKSAPGTVTDTVYFGQWNGKKIIIEDNYKYQENEKGMTQKEGSDYGAYGDTLKELVKKYGKYSEQEYEYYFTEFKPEFAAYTNLRPGQVIFTSSAGGVQSTKINGYYINLDDMIGSGAIFYATADKPEGTAFEEREMMVCSANNNMTRINKTGVTDQAVIDKFSGYVMPKLAGSMINVYDEKTGKETKKKLEKLAAEEIKIFKGNFTGSGKEEYLVGVRFNTEATSFTSAIWIMDDAGNVIKELSPLTQNNFTFSEPDMIVDFNGDGVWEVITNDGYYEGGGYNFHKFAGGAFKVMTTGFTFGV
jgi:hypothetical protein